LNFTVWFRWHREKKKGRPQTSSVIPYDEFYILCFCKSFCPCVLSFISSQAMASQVHNNSWAPWSICVPLGHR
jgi:hypothetical protein